MPIQRTILLLTVLLGMVRTGAAQTGSATPIDTPGVSPHVSGQESELVLAPASVQFRGNQLFVIRDTLGPKTPEERAIAIERRIESIASQSDREIDRLESRDRQVTTDIVAGDVVIMTVTERDANPTGRSRQQVAADNIRLLKYRLALDRNERTFLGIVHAMLYTLGCTVLLVVLILTVNILKKRLRKRVTSWEGTRIRSLRLQTLELLPARRVVELLVHGIHLFSITTYVSLFMVYSNTVLSFFPWSRTIAQGLFREMYRAAAWVFGGIVGYLPNILYIALIAISSNYILRFLKLIFRELDKGSVKIPGFYGEWATPTYKIVRFLFLAFMAVIIFPYLPGSNSPAFQGVSIFIGLLLSLGSTAAIANLVAGIVLTYMRPFSAGDRVKIADTIGDVIEKSLLVVRIRTIKNVEITIANAMVLNNHIINYSTCAAEQGLILHSSVTIGYDVPWKKVHELLIAAAVQTENILAEPAPFVLQTSLDDFYVSYEINAYTKLPQQMAKTYSRLHANIQDRFNETGIEILSPHYRAGRDGNASAIPSEYLPEDYHPPAFAIRQIQSPSDK